MILTAMFLLSVAAGATPFEVTTPFAGKLAKWLKAADGLPDPPFHEMVTEPPGLPATYAVGCGFAPAYYTHWRKIKDRTGAERCYNKYNVDGPAPALLSVPGIGTITTADRIEYLSYYCRRYDNPSAPLCPTSYLTAASFTFPSLGGTGVFVTTPPDRVNALAGRIRHNLYKERDAAVAELNALKTLIGSTMPTRASAADRNMKPVIDLANRQIKLLDYMFTDAALWHIRLEPL
jgi:hypothetical protein